MTSQPSRRTVGSPRNGSDTGAAATATAAASGVGAGTGASAPAGGGGGGGGGGTELLAAASADARKKSWNERFWTTWAMIGGFVGLIAIGHPVLVVFVAILQAMMFREVHRLGLKASAEQSLPYFKFLPWWWYATAVFFSYGRVLMNEFQIEVPYHTFIAFSMYAAGLCWFVLSLEQPHFKYQFSVFAWVQLTLLIIVMQSSFLIVNMFHGLIWFVLPCLLIISNDTWAYFFGFFWGRTPLIALSPKKTWEGFLGGFLMTIIKGFVLARLLAQFDLMICPKYELSFSHPHCTPALPFHVNQYAVPSALQWLLGSTVGIMPIQWHGIGLGVFASLIAPFGGFFASGFKRAFKIKDFGDLIPGHGGVTDRMDCQIMMGLFVWVYYTNFVREVMDTQFVWTQFAKLSADKQLDFFMQTQRYLGAAGLLPPK